MATEGRVRDALEKRARGVPLTEREWTLVQYAEGGGCHACGIKIAVVKARSGRVH